MSDQKPLHPGETEKTDDPLVGVEWIRFDPHSGHKMTVVARIAPRGSMFPTDDSNVFLVQCDCGAWFRCARETIERRAS